MLIHLWPQFSRLTIALAVELGGGASLGLK